MAKKANVFRVALYCWDKENFSAEISPKEVCRPFCIYEPFQISIAGGKFDYKNSKSRFHDIKKVYEGSPNQRKILDALEEKVAEKTGPMVPGQSKGFTIKIASDGTSETNSPRRHGKPTIGRGFANRKCLSE